jgi:Flp pilus assembly protein TadG
VIGRKRRGAETGRQGQTLVEFALILPIFVLILVGIFDGGRLVFAYHTVNNAAREAGREATVNQTEADIQGRAAQHAVALDIDPADVVVSYLPGFAGQNCAIGTAQIVGCIAVVQVSYEFVPAIPLMAFVMGTNSLTVTGEVQFPVEFNCVDNPPVDCPLGQ